MKTIFSPGSKKAIFFDLNGTLVDKEGTFDAAFMQTIREYTDRWDKAGADLPQHALEAYRRERARLGGGKRSSSGSQTIRLACLRAALHDLPASQSTEALRRLNRRIRELQERQPLLFPDVKPALERIARRYRIAVISNGRRGKLQSRLSRSGLLPLIPEDRLFTPAPIGHGKPHPDIFRHALQTIGVSAEQAVMVGDSKIKDVDGALSAGLDAVWVRRGHRIAPYLKTTAKGRMLAVRSLQQLEDYL